jgi:hypothetical protein
MKRHIGKVINTDQRCLVIYMQIPGKESHALICPSESLPDRIEAAVMSLVDSSEGQNEPVLAGVLGRRLLPETGKTVLQSLHEAGLLHAIPIDNMVMLPMPNMPFPLRGIIEQMGGTVPQPETEADKAVKAAAEVKYNPYGHTADLEATDNNRAIAANILAEAIMLEDEAFRKREQAYRHNPSLRPTNLVEVPAATTVAITEEVVAPKKTRAKKATPAS